MKCIGPRAEDADLWMAIVEDLNDIHAKEILIEFEHVKAHRTEKEWQQMSFFEKLIIECNERVDDLAKEGSMLGGGFMAQTRSNMFQQDM